MRGLGDAIGRIDALAGAVVPRLVRPDGTGADRSGGHDAAAVPPAAGDVPLGLWIVIGLVLVIMLVVGMSAAGRGGPGRLGGEAFGSGFARLAGRRRRGGEPAERAFVRLARSFGLDDESSETVRELASAIDAKPVGLLISESAFVRAVRALEQPTEPGDPGLSLAQKRRLVQIRHQLFAGEPIAR